MASVALINSLSESFTQLRNSFRSSFDDSTLVENSANAGNSSSFEPLNNEEILPASTQPPSTPPTNTQPPLFSSTPHPAINATSVSLFSASQPSSQTKLPPTQNLVVRLKKLRDVGDSSAPHYRVVENDDDRVDDVAILRQQLDEVKSELMALRLQFDIDQEEKKTLIKEHLPIY